MNFYLFLLLFIVTSCSDFQKGTLTVEVENNKHLAVANNEISLFAVNHKNTEAIKIAAADSKLGNSVKWDVDFSKLQTMKLVIRNKEIDKIYLPEIVFLSAPKWWQDRDLKLTISLKEIQLQAKKNIVDSGNKEKEKSKTESSILDFPSDPISQSLSIQQIEEPLSPETLPELGLAKSIFDISKPTKGNLIENEGLKEALFLNTITEKKSNLYEDTIVVEVLNNGKPVENSYVFLGRNGTQAIRYAGTTDAAGSISLQVLHQYRPDVILVKKDTFITSYKPLTSGSGKQNFRVDLAEGKSTDFILQHYAYFVGRGLDKTELRLNSLKLDISNLLGFVSAQKQVDEKSFFTLLQKNAVPENIDSRSLKKSIEISELSNRIPMLFVSSVLPYKPAVGFIEPPILGALQNNAIWRRARREFFSRFMNEMFIRSIISDDVNKMANTMNISAIEMARQGWKDSQFAGELDVIFQLYFDEHEDGKELNLIGKIYDKTGKIIFDKEETFKPPEAEKAAASLYSVMLANLPIEGAVIKKNKKEITINLGKNQHLVPADLFVIYAQKNLTSPPDRPIGVGKVKSVAEKESILDIQIGWEQIEKNEVLRVIRYPEKLIQQEIQKQIASF